MRKPAILHYGDTLPSATEFEEGDMFYLRPSGELYIRSSGTWALSASGSMLTSVQNDGSGVELVSDTGTAHTAKVRSVNTTGNGITLAITASGQEVELNFDKVAAGWGAANGFATLDANSLLREFPQLSNIAALRSASNIGSTIIYVRGYYSDGDGGEGLFYMDPSDTTSADNGGTIIVDSDGKRWKRKFSGPVSVRWFGAKGDGVADDTSAINAAIDVSEVVYIPKGTYLVSQTIVMKSDLHIFGDGKTSLLKASAVFPIIEFGGINTTAFTAPNISYKVANNPSQGDTQITMSVASDAANYSPGDVVVLWSAEGYTTALGYFVPYYQQIVRVKSVDSTTGVVSLYDEIYDTYTGTEFRVTKSGEFVNTEGAASVLTANVHMHDLAFYVDGDSWSRWGGTYNSIIENIYIEKSDGVFVNNGFAKSILRGVRGQFVSHGIDVSYLSHDSVISDVVVSQEDGSSLDLFINIAEGAKNIHLSEVNIRASGTSSTLDAINIDGSGNKITNSNFVLKNCRRLVSITGRYGYWKYIPVLISDSHIEATSCSNVLFIADVDSIASNPVGAKINNVAFGCSSVSANSIYINGSRIDISGVRFDTPSGSIFAASGVVDCSITNCHWSYTPTNSISTSASVYRSGWVFNNDSIHRALALYSSGGSITTTTPTTLISRTFPSGTISAKSAMSMRVFGVASGTNDAKYVAVTINGTEVAKWTSATGFVGTFYVDGVIQLMPNGTDWWVFLSVNEGGAASIYYGTITPTGDTTIEITTYVANSLDSVTIAHAQLVPEYV